MCPIEMKAGAIPPFIVTASYAGTVIYPPGGSFGPRIQQDLQLVFLHTGEMHIEIDSIGHQIPVGHAVLLKPGHTESFAFAKDKETWHRWIAVSIEMLRPDALQAFERLPLSIPLSQPMIRILELMMLLQKGTSAYQEVLNQLSRSAIQLYWSETYQQEKTIGKHPAVLAAKEFIHQHYEQELDLSTLALHSYTTREHLIRLFNRYEEMTPSQYIWQYRTLQGVHMLQSTGLHIGEIAERTGFKTPYHFSRMVKRQTSKTPTEIRNESWKQSR